MHYTTRLKFPQENYQDVHKKVGYWSECSESSFIRFPGPNEFGLKYTQGLYNYQKQVECTHRYMKVKK